MMSSFLHKTLRLRDIGPTMNQKLFASVPDGELVASPPHLDLEA
jgi:hypothetical protein